MRYLIVQLFFSCGTGCREWVIRCIIAVAILWQQGMKASPAEKPNRSLPSPARGAGSVLWHAEGCIFVIV